MDFKSFTTSCNNHPNPLLQTLHDIIIQIIQVLIKTQYKNIVKLKDTNISTYWNKDFANILKTVSYKKEMEISITPLSYFWESYSDVKTYLWSSYNNFISVENKHVTFNQVPSLNKV